MNIELRIEGLYLGEVQRIEKVFNEVTDRSDIKFSSITIEQKRGEDEQN